MLGRRSGSAFRPGRIAVGLVAAAVMIGGSPALAGASAKTAPRITTTYTLQNVGAPVTIDKASWVLSIQYTSDPPANSLSIGITRVVTAGGTGAELHTWGFAYSKVDALTFNTKTDGATINTGTTYDPIGTFDLTFTATSHAAGKCASGSETIYTGTLKGKAELTTGFKGIAVVGGASVTFNAPHSAPQLVADDGCVPEPASPCVAIAILASSTTGVIGDAIDGTEFGATVDFVNVDEKTALSSPVGASRVDAALLDKPTVSYSSKAKSMTVTASASGIVTGSATVSGGTFKSVSTKCSFATKTYTLTTSITSKAKYSSPAGKNLVGHMTLTPILTAPASTATGQFEDVTVS